MLCLDGNSLGCRAVHLCHACRRSLVSHGSSREVVLSVKNAACLRGESYELVSRSIAISVLATSTVLMLQWFIVLWKMRRHICIHQGSDIGAVRECLTTPALHSFVAARAFGDTTCKPVPIQRDTGPHRNCTFASKALADGRVLECRYPTVSVRWHEITACFTITST